MKSEFTALPTECTNNQLMIVMPDATPKRVYRRTAPSTRNPTTINTTGLRSVPSDDTQGDTVMFPAFRISPNLMTRWLDIVECSGKPSAFMGRLAITRLTQTPKAELETAIAAFTTPPAKIQFSPPPAKLIVFPLLRVRGETLIEFKRITLEQSQKHSLMARLAFHRIATMTEDAIAKAIINYSQRQPN
jgi:hypothetical protein